MRATAIAALLAACTASVGAQAANPQGGSYGGQGYGGQGYGGQGNGGQGYGDQDYVPRLYAPDGSIVPVTDLLGPEPLVVNIWGSWCGPCLQELPSLAALNDWLVPQGGRVVLIAADQAPPAQINQFLQQRLGLRGMTSYVDGGGEVTNYLGVSMFPTTLIVDRNGDLLDVVEQAADWNSQYVRDYLASWIGKTDPWNQGPTQDQTSGYQTQGPQWQPGPQQGWPQYNAGYGNDGYGSGYANGGNGFCPPGW